MKKSIIILAFLMMLTVGGCVNMNQDNGGSSNQDVISNPENDKTPNQDKGNTSNPGGNSSGGTGSTPQGSSPYLAYDYDTYYNVALPVDELYAKTPDGKVVVQADDAIFDLGFNFKEFMDGKDNNEGLEYFIPLVLEHLEKKYGETFTVDEKSTPSTSQYGGYLKLVYPNGEVLNANYSIVYRDDGTLQLGFSDTYICFLMAEEEEPNVIEVIKPVLAEYGINDALIGFSSYDSAMIQLFGAGATFWDVNEYYLEYKGHAFECGFRIDYNFGHTEQNAEELTELAISVAKALEDANYNGFLSMYDYSPSEWERLTSDEIFNMGNYPQADKKIWLELGNDLSKTADHYSTVEGLGWRDN